jgi:Mg2+-importing ATPase
MPWDRVDEEFLVEPCEWNTASISSFMRWMGPVSSVFDLVTFALLFFVVCPEACGGTWSAALGEGQRALFVATFQAGWFVESMVTQMLVVQMLRTPHVPFVQSRASVQVILAGLGAIAAAVLLTFSPLAEALDFSPLPMSYFWMLLLIAAGYMALASVAKGVYVRRYGRLL